MTKHYKGDESTMFKKLKRGGGRPPIPENLESYIRMAPPEAVLMRCQIIYSAYPNMSGMLFQGWRDEDNDVIEVDGEKPPFSSVIPSDVVAYYFNTENNIGRLDVDMMRKYLGIRVEYIDDEEEEYNPRHLDKNEEEDGTLIMENTPYKAKHRAKGEEDSIPVPAPQRQMAAPLNPSTVAKAKKRREEGRRAKDSQVAQSRPTQGPPVATKKKRAPVEEPLPQVSPRVNPKNR